MALSESITAKRSDGLELILQVLQSASRKVHPARLRLMAGSGPILDHRVGDMTVLCSCPVVADHQLKVEFEIIKLVNWESKAMDSIGEDSGGGETNSISKSQLCSKNSLSTDSIESEKMNTLFPPSLLVASSSARL